MAIFLGGLGEKAYRRLGALELERHAVLRLVQDGFAVVAPDAHPELLIRVREAGDALIMEAIGGGRVLAHRTMALGGESLAEVHLEVIQKAVELARACLRPPAAPPSSLPAAEPAGSASRPSTLALPSGGGRRATSAAAVSARPGTGVEASIGAAALYRGGGTDLLGRLGLRVGVGRWLALHLDAGMALPREDGMDAVEWQVQAGPGVRLGLGRRLDLWGAVLAGALGHHYRLADASAASPSGARFDFLACFPVGLRWWPLPALGVELRVAPGLAGEDRVHARGEQGLWQRRAFRLEAGIGIAWRLR